MVEMEKEEWEKLENTKFVLTMIWTKCKIRKKAEEEEEIGKVAKIGYNKLSTGKEEWRWNKTEKSFDRASSKN